MSCVLSGQPLLIFREHYEVSHVTLYNIGGETSLPRLLSFSPGLAIRSTLSSAVLRKALGEIRRLPVKLDMALGFVSL